MPSVALRDSLGRKNALYKYLIVYFTLLYSAKKLSLVCRVRTCIALVDADPVARFISRSFGLTFPKSGTPCQFTLTMSGIVYIFHCPVPRSSVPAYLASPYAFHLFHISFQSGKFYDGHHETVLHNNKLIYAVKLSSAVTLGEAYDGGSRSTWSRDDVICCRWSVQGRLYACV